VEIYKIKKNLIISKFQLLASHDGLHRILVATAVCASISLTHSVVHTCISRASHVQATKSCSVPTHTSGCGLDSYNLQ